MRASVRRHASIAVPADAAWAVVTRADVLQHWFPGLRQVVMKTPTIRTVTTGAGLSLDEEIVTNDPLQRRFQYRIAGGFFKEHLASIDVIALADDRCLVTYASDADPATMAIVLGGAMEAALTSLTTQLEAGVGPVLDAIAAPPPPVPASESASASEEVHT
ncbi:MAG TPA: SRPBCC family protein [Iamia sp.]|jgi:carbon monoxide dehydrogenase subunit G|nr:SRPBCC family protein [Iamia sp.]